MEARRVIRSYLLITGLFTLSASLIWGINTLFLLDAGLTIFEVFVANAAFTAAMALFEIPTGVIADTRGRRLSFLLSEATLIVGTLAYVGVAAIHGGLLLFCLAGVILGLGFSFYSGAVEAWVVDALKATGYTHELDVIFSRAGIVNGVATLIGTVSGGLLGHLHLSLPYLGRAGLLAIAFIVGIRSMHDIGFTPRALQLEGVVGAMRRVAAAGLTFGWRTPSMRLLVMHGFIVYGFFYWAWYAWQPYFLGLYGRDAIWLAGVIAALFSIAQLTGNALVGRLARPGRRRTAILLAASGVLAIAMVGTGIIQSFWVTVAIFLVGALAAGVLQPVRQAYLHNSIPTSERATLVSFDSLVTSLGSIGGSTGLGYLSQVRSVPFGFIVGGATTFLALPLFARLRSLKEPADRIEPDAPERETAVMPGQDVQSGGA